jgi:hypothetical protein
MIDRTKKSSGNKDFMGLRARSTAARVRPYPSIGHSTLGNADSDLSLVYLSGIKKFGLKQDSV